MEVIGQLKTSAREWDLRFLRQAVEVASWSKDPEVKVGAVLVSPDKRRFAVGYNGFPHGVTDTKDRLRGPDRVALTAHAELNALLNAATDLDGWTLYCTRQPCIECAKAIIQSRVARVVCPALETTSSWFDSCQKGATIMREAGIRVDLMESNL